MRTQAVGTIVLLMGAVAAVVPASPTPSDSTHLEQIRELIAQSEWSAAESLAVVLQTRLESRTSVDSLQLAEAFELRVRARNGGGRFNEPGTLELAQEALRIRERTLGPKHPDVARSLVYLARIHRVLGDAATARPLAERAVDIAESSLGSEHLELARALHGLADISRDEGQLDRAELLLRRALGIREKAGGEGARDAGRTLIALGQVATLSGRYREAQQLLTRATEVLEDHLGGDHPLVAFSLQYLANTWIYLGDPNAALPLIERCLHIRESRLGANHPEVANTLLNLATCHHRAGDYAKAQPIYERALAVQIEAFGHQHRVVARTLNNFGMLRWALGDYVGANADQERALAIWEETLGPNHPELTGALTALATNLSSTGDLLGARPHLERALAIQEKSLGPEHSTVGESLYALGTLLEKMGEFGDARPLLERALAVQEATLGSEHDALALTLISYGKVLSKLGEWSAAETHYQRALAMQEKLYGPDYPFIPWSLGGLAGIRRQAGDLAGARALWDRVRTIQDKILPSEHPENAVTMIHLAEIEAELGDVESALALALEAERIGREHLRLTIRTFSESAALQYAATRPSGLDLALAIVGRRPDPTQVRRIWDELVDSRALVLEEMAERRHAGQLTRDSRTEQLHNELSEASRSLAHLIVQGFDLGGTEEYRAQLDEARNHRDRAQQRLAEESSAFRQTLSSTGLTLADVSGALPPASALVAYVRYAQQVQNTDAYLAFVLPAGERDPRVVALGDAGSIDRLITTWRTEAATGALLAGRTQAQAEALYRIAGNDLRGVVWDPVAPLLTDAERVFVVSAGALHLVNLAALPAVKGSYLVEGGPLIHEISSERDLVSFEDSHPKGRGLLVLGGPSFDSSDPLEFDEATHRLQTGVFAQALDSPAPFRGMRSDCPDFSDVRFKPLPASAEETERIALLWEKTAGMDQAVCRLTGDEAHEAAVKRLAPGRKILHLATHGFFIGETCHAGTTTGRGISRLTPSLSASVSDTADGPAETESLGPRRVTNPLLLSGIALAGANRREFAGPDEDDGILTAEEIASLDLSGVEWAVLSACNTGLGEIGTGLGEGVFGLRRALQVAGARTVILSLWDLRDEVALRWMDLLYEARLRDGLDTAQAVNTATLGLLRERRAAGESTHPFYWAGLVAAGDWR